MNTAMIINLILALIVIGIALFLTMLTIRIHKLTRGKRGAHLEEIIKENNELIHSLGKQLRHHEEAIADLKHDALRNIQNIGVIRFNPFKETGGSQSFVVALTDKEQNGVVISSLYARERVNVFAKPIINGNSEYTLSQEERAAIDQSRGN
ncbi:DUF4446 family protein [Patescibacteria group bacterium]|nr:DUF4446 family protein [Patescibacteria group bacterium]